MNGPLLNVGNEISEECMNRIKAGIETVFRVGFETHMEQKTVRRALDVLARIVVVEGLTINNSTFQGCHHEDSADSAAVKLGNT